MQFSEHLSEDDLRKAMRPQDPGPAFTQRVMAGVAQQQEAKAAAARQKRQWPSWLRWLTVRPALSAAVAALVLVIGIGLGYQHHQQVLREQAINDAKGKDAERQVMLALRITNVKLNQVFKRVNEPAGPGPRQEPKIRRQSL